MAGWTKERVMEIITTNKALAIQALLALYDSQTEAEKAHHATHEDNGVGFCKFDSELLTSFAQQVKLRGWLSGKQMIVLRRRLPKYWRQIGPLLHPEVAQEMRGQEERQLNFGSW
jgi:hypothetical protein